MLLEIIMCYQMLLIVILCRWESRCMLLLDIRYNYILSYFNMFYQLILALIGFYYVVLDVIRVLRCH